MDKETKKQKQTKRTSRQMVALAGVILLVLLYLATLVAAFVDRSASGRLFWICLFATIAVPVLIWVYTWIYGKLTGKSTLADMPSVQPQDAQDSQSGQDTANQASRSF